MHSNVALALRAYRAASSLHTRTYEYLVRVRGEIPGMQTGDLSDLLHVLRQASGVLDDLRKEVDQLAGIAEAAAGLQFTSTAGLNCEKSRIEGELTYGYPESHDQIKIPEKRTPEYEDFCRKVGITKEMIDADCVRFHWPNLCALSTELSREGRHLPGIDPHATRIKTVVRTRWRGQLDIAATAEQVEAKK
jgi:hypothetical protein